MKTLFLGITFLTMGSISSAWADPVENYTIDPSTYPVCKEGTLRTEVPKSFQGVIYTFFENSRQYELTIGPSGAILLREFPGESEYPMGWQFKKTGHFKCFKQHFALDRHGIPTLQITLWSRVNSFNLWITQPPELTPDQFYSTLIYRNLLINAQTYVGTARNVLPN